MSKVATEHVFTGLTTSITSYDSTKTSMGSLMVQTTGATSTDFFAGPIPIGMARPMEASTSIPGIFPHVLTYSSTIDWVFLADNATAAANRRVVFYEFNKQTSTFNWKGFVTLTFSTATVFTVRGMRVMRELYTGGTVSVNGTTVTGTGTTWVTDSMTVGSRIGFGSSDPTQINSWYEISTANTNTSIVLTNTAGVSGGSLNYVIEDLKIGLSMTNATLGNGGLFLVKGLRIENFSPAGTSIASGATDNIRATYWLADAAVVTNTAAGGLAREDKTSWASQNVFVLDTAGRVYKYNVRAPLTSIVGGKSTSAFLFATGVQAPTGTMSQNNNGRIATLQHGPGAGVPSLYWATTTRIYRSAVSGITSASTTWQSDAMLEVPPGGTNTYAASGTLSNVEVSDAIDSLIIMNVGTASARSYVTKYNTNSTQFDKIFLVDSRQLDQSTADAGEVPHPSIQALTYSVWSENGLTYLSRQSAVSTTNQLYVVPLGADWSYASTTNQRIITPELFTPSAVKLYRAYISNRDNLGSINLGLSTEPFRTYYRTAGIVDNSGPWTLIGDDGLLSGVAPASSIQFMFEFKTIGTYCIPGRLYSITILYEDGSTDSHFQPSIGLSSITNKQFSWRLSSAFGGNIPAMRVRLYDAVSNALLVDDNTSSPTGTFEKTTDGGSNWVAWNNTDKGNETTYLRYTPLSLGDNIKVRALLTLN